jgi:hypothetical protein
VSNKDTIIEALTIQLKIEREGNFALVNRIAELEKQEPLVWMNKYGHVASFKNDEYTAPLYTAPVQAIAEDKWEPKIYRCYSPNGDLISIIIKRTPDGEREQIHPPKRDNLSSVEQPDLARVGEVGVWGEWVGLTDQEIKDIRKDFTYNDEDFNEFGFAKAIEAKLKEKNTYTAPVHDSDISQERVDETAKHKHEWVGLDDDIPGLGLVTEEFYNGMLCAEDILRKRNT